ncbi:MAG: hypothetical protein FWF88_09400 [Peptococcaceae bacterium]|nr:hypothetical protein [Peptococcaceae bacterium]
MDVKEIKSDADFIRYAETVLPGNTEEAARRFAEYKDKDPYPNIQPALLNSGDIFKYVNATGMIYPFYVNTELFSGASYEARINGEVIYWDKHNNEVRKDLSQPGSFFELESNSIAFVTLEPEFRIPSYMALRFNLKIRHIYKGLLLGTGPLVDPGFEGRLSIPLHNLTNNKYTFSHNDSLIQIEFTKLSPNERWAASGVQAASGPEPGPESEPEPAHYIDTQIPKFRGVKEYIAKAIHPKKTVSCSIPLEIQKSEETVRKSEEAAEHAKKEAQKASENAETSGKLAVEARESADKAEKTLKRWTAIGGLAMVASVCGLIISLSNLVQGANTRIDNIYNKVDSHVQKILELEKINKDLTDEIDKLKQEIDDLQHPAGDI